MSDPLASLHGVLLDLRGDLWTDSGFLKKVAFDSLPQIAKLFFSRAQSGRETSLVKAFLISYCLVALKGFFFFLLSSSFFVSCSFVLLFFFCSFSSS